MKKNATWYILIFLGVAFIIIMLVFPLAVIINNAFRGGINPYTQALTNHFTIEALELTIKATGIAVVFNTLFGLVAAWSLTRFNWKGDKFMTTVIDIPFSISPVIAGLLFALTFGRAGWLQPVVQALGTKIVFAVPGIILATVFVTLPFVARTVMPVLNARGVDEEEAASLMGAGGLTIFSKITFPHIKWAFLYGIILCTARAMGEFGAVSVISGNLRGKTVTLPLLIEILYNDFKTIDAFAVSTILVILALILLVLKIIIEARWFKKKG
jgi:sulfate transport system permease protein